MISIEINNRTKIRINKILIKKILSQALKLLKRQMEISIAIVNQNEIQRLNRIYRKINRVTDVLAFPNFVQKFERRLVTKLKTNRIRQSAKEADYFGGEIIICYQQARKQAKIFGHSTQEEIKILLIHGLLHLLGYEHKTKRQKEKMDKMMKNLLMYS